MDEHKQIRANPLYLRHQRSIHILERRFMLALRHYADVADLR